MPNELYAQNMECRHQYNEIIKHFSEGHLKGAGWVQKDLQLHNINIALMITHHNSLWVLTQKYNSVSKDVREQIKWFCLFFTKDRDSFEDCLRENDVIPDKSERNRLKKCLQDRPYSKLILKCYQSTGYHLL